MSKLKQSTVLMLLSVVLATTLLACTNSANDPVDTLFSMMSGTETLQASDMSNNYIVSSVYHSEGAENRTVVLEVDQSYFLHQSDSKSEPKVDVEMFMGTVSEHFSFTMNEDGLVKLQMTPEYYAALEADMKARTVTSLNELIGSEWFPYVSDISWNGKFTKLTIEVDGTMYADMIASGKLTQDNAPGTAALAPLIYQVFTPDGVVGCRVTVIDAETNVEMGSFMFPSDIGNK